MTIFPEVPMSQALDEVLSAALDVTDEPLPLGDELAAGDLIGQLRALVPGGDWARGVADMVGVDRRTIQRIAAGTSRGSKRAVAELRRAWDDQRRPLEAARRRRVAAQRQAARKALVKPGGTLKISGTVEVSNEERVRTLDLSPWLTAKSREAIISAWEHAGGDAAAAAFQQALGNDYATGMEINSVEDLTWE